MLVSLRELTGYEIHSRNGTVGTASDFLFDQKNWSVKYIVDKSSKSWGKGKEILVAAKFIQKIDLDLKNFQLDIDREQLKNSPHIKVSAILNPEQHLPSDANNVFIRSDVINNLNIARMEDFVNKKRYKKTNTLDNQDLLHVDKRQKRAMLIERGTEEIRSLQSADKTLGFKISSRNGDHGYMEDMIVNDDDWSVNYLVINTKRNFNGKKILISPESVDWVSWRKKHVSIDLEKEKLSGCPNFNMVLPLNNEQQPLLRNKYECSHFWA